jgi:heme exporter protein B
LVSGLPLLLVAPLLGVTYYLPQPAILALCLTLFLGTPTLSLLGSIGAALTAGVRQSGGLLALLVLPLMLPVLMFGARATDLAGAGETISGPVYLLGAFLALALSLVPFATAAAIRISLD